MKKKTFILAAATLLLAATSCRKAMPAGPAGEAGQHVAVNLRIAGSSKVTDVSPGSETSFTSAQFFIYDDSGVLEDYVSSSASSVTLGALAGSKTFVAVLNAKDDLSGAGTLQALNAAVTELKDNVSGHFVMTGVKSQTVSGTTADVEIAVRRQVAKVVIKKVTTDFSSTALRNASFVIDRFYLINAAGDAKIGGTGSPSFWYNESGYHLGGASAPAAADHLVSDNVAVDLSGNDSYQTPHAFYTYPNNFAVHPTVLELAVRINGETDWYCIDFSRQGVTGIEANKTYTVEELVIKHRGNDHDGDGVVDDAVTFDCTVSISDWETGLAPYTENL